MAYVPYSTVPRDSTPKTGAISGVSMYPLFQQKKTVKVIPKIPNLSLLTFAFSGSVGSTSANPAMTWSNSGGTPATLTYVLYGDTNNPPTTVVTTQTLSVGATSYTYTGATVGNYYYKAVVTAVNVSGTSTITTSVLQNVFNPNGLSAPLITWFKGDLGLTTSSWSNYGTNGGSLTWSSTISTTTVNSLTAASIPANVFGTFAQTWSRQPCGLFVVYKPATTLSTSGIYFQNKGNSPAGTKTFWQYYATATAQQTYLTAMGVANKIVTNAYDASSTTNPSLVSAVNSAIRTANNSAYFNSTSESLTASVIASGYATGTNTYTLNGLSGAIGNDIPIIWCEYLVYEGELSSADTSAIVNYLRTKWNVPA